LDIGIVWDFLLKSLGTEATTVKELGNRALGLAPAHVTATAIRITV
jgi:hypothetical protein